MDCPIYLDTARIGRMSPGARRACSEALSIASDNPRSLFEEYLMSGNSLESGVNGIPVWSGITGLTRKILNQSRANNDNRLLMASTSSSLVKLAARSAFLICRRMLCTDLLWNQYDQILSREAKWAGGTVRKFQLRKLAKRKGFSEEQLVDEVAEEFKAQSCDGLFLTAVSSDGIRLPLEKIVARIRQSAEPRFIVIDGAQEFSHCPVDLGRRDFDIYLFGSHKWLGSHLPLTVGLYGRVRSKHFIETTLERMLLRDQIADPLLNCVAKLNAKSNAGINETVNILPLFAASGALADQPDDLKTDFEVQKRNGDTVREICDSTNWKDCSPIDDMRTGIIVVENHRLRGANPFFLESQFRNLGIELTANDNGRIRMSMPKQKLSKESINQIQSAVAAVDSQ